MEAFVARNYRVFFSGLIVVLMVLCFMIGRGEGKASNTSEVTLSCSPEVLESLAIKPEALATLEGDSREPAAISATPLPSEPSVLSAAAVPIQGKFLGSKNGTKYYTPNCSGAKRIKPENYVWFSDEEDAKLQGYTPANC